MIATNAVLSLSPEQPDVDLCDLTQLKEQVCTEHLGQRYFQTTSEQTAHLQGEEIGVGINQCSNKTSRHQLIKYNRLLIIQMAHNLS